MADEKITPKEETKTQDKSEPKKLEEFKNTPENKEAIAKDEGKVPPKAEKKEVAPAKAVAKKSTSKPALKKASKKSSKKAEPEKKAQLERIYTVPLKKNILTVPLYRRAKKAVRVLKEFLAQHMNVENRDLRKVKVDINLNNEIWFRGIKKPVNKIKVKARKVDGIVYAELAEIPDVVKFKLAREEKAKAAAMSKKERKAAEKAEAKPADKDGDGVADVLEEKEDQASTKESSAKAHKAEATKAKHTPKVKTGKEQAQQVHRKALKR